MKLAPNRLRRSRPRDVVHAGPLLMGRADGAGALRRYLTLPRRRDVFLVHAGQERLRATAAEAGVDDIPLAAESAEQEARAAGDKAVALGARSLDFAIAESAVVSPNGEALREITTLEASALAANPRVRPRIRAKLRAGVAAMCEGVSQVRIGSPAALATDHATRLVPEPSIPGERPARSPGPEPDRKAPAPTPPGRLPTQNPPLVMVRGDGPSPFDAPRSARLRFSPRAGRCEVGVPSRVVRRSKRGFRGQPHVSMPCAHPAI